MSPFGGFLKKKIRDAIKLGRFFMEVSQKRVASYGICVCHPPTTWGYLIYGKIHWKVPFVGKTNASQSDLDEEDVAKGFA